MNVAALNTLDNLEEQRIGTFGSLEVALLWVKEAWLSLVSPTVMVTEVVDVLPEGIPLMSWALTTTTYWLLVSRSRVFVLELITPERDRRTEGVS